MKVDELFPSRFVKGEDIAAKGSVTVTIRSVTIEEMGKDREQNPVVWFEKTPKGLVLKKTNAMTIKALYGADTDDWRGKRITLTTEKMNAFGDIQTVIKVVNRVPEQQAKPAPIPAPTSTPSPSEWEAQGRLRKIAAFAMGADRLWEEGTDVMDLVSTMRQIDADSNELMSVTPAAGKQFSMYGYLCLQVDTAIGIENVAEAVLTYILGRVITKATPPAQECRLLMDDLTAEGDNDYRDAVLAVYAAIQENIPA